MRKFPRLYSRAQVILLAGANLVLTSLQLTVPTLFSASTSDLLLLAVGIVSVQAGQASAVQTQCHISTRRSIIVAFIVALASTAAILTECLSWNTQAIATGAVALSGLLLGMLTGARAADLLATNSASAYQKFLLSRNSVWFLCVLCTCMIDVDSLSFATPLAWMLIAIGLVRRESRETKTGFALWLGAISGLAYRNDVNIARAMADPSAFTSWHLTFVVYVLVQAAVGFVVVNELFRRRADISDALRSSHLLIIGAMVNMATVGAFALVVLAGPSDRDFNLIVAIALFPASILVAIQAAIAHILDQSWVVYVAGTFGIAALLLSDTFGMNPGAGISAELAISGLFVSLAVTVSGLRRRGALLNDSAPISRENDREGVYKSENSAHSAAGK